MLPRLLLLWFILLSACGEQSAPPVKCEKCWCAGGTDPLPGEVELGSGTGSTFEPMQDGEVLTIHRGPQGGYHVFLQARTRGMDKDSTRTLFSAFREEGEEIDTVLCPHRLPYSDAGDGYGVLPYTVALILDNDWVANCSATGAMVRVVVEVEDDEGHYAMDERFVIARLEDLPAINP